MNKLKRTVVYLSGAMDRVKDGGVTWRKYIADKLRIRYDVGILNPCDKPTFEAIEDDKQREIRQSLLNQGKYDKVEEMMKPIVRVDLRMVDRADFLILHVDKSVHMCGSYDEQTRAILERKPTLIVCEQGKSGIPHWLFGTVPHRFMFSNFDEMFEYLDRINSGEVVEPKYWHFFDYDKIFYEV